MINLNNYTKIKQACKANNSQLVAVSKKRTNAAILELHKQGQVIFGENRVQEVKQVLPHLSLIHSIDSLRLLNAVQQEAEKLNIKANILLQFHIAEESAKYGFDVYEIENLITELEENPHPNIEIFGVMGMATFTDDLTQIRAEFKKLKNVFEELKQNYFSTNTSFKEISMGMSGDYEIALEEGSTMVRVGSALFS